jgi:hypothetical protein
MDEKSSSGPALKFKDFGSALVRGSFLDEANSDVGLPFG